MLRMTALLLAGIAGGVIIGYALFGLESAQVPGVGTDARTIPLLEAIGTSVVKDPTPTPTATVFIDSLPLCSDDGVDAGDVCLQVYTEESEVDFCNDLLITNHREFAIPCRKLGDEES